jgi:CubicO group peptidase (beta-lactamase class C family)
MHKPAATRPFLLVLFLLPAANTALATEPLAARIERVETDLQPAILLAGQTPKPFPLAERMHFYKTPGISIAVINGGVIEWARGYGVLAAGTPNAVTPDTIFQAASIGKPVAALVALRLVEQGKLSLDEDVNGKLVSWKLPENEFTKHHKVTLRWLLSHRAGLTDGAGFLRALPTEPLPTLRDILETGRWTPAPIRVGFEPGSRFRYSGGGYCLLEQLLEDVTGKPFPVLARQLVFEPLGMVNSSFEQPLSPERAPAAAVGHLANGQPLPQKWNIYPASSAAGLWTTPTDLARFAIEIQKSRTGQSLKCLSPALTAEMLTTQGGANEGDAKLMARIEEFPDHWPLSRGLGVGLIGQPPTRFYHTGSNPGYQCELHAYVESGQGAIVMTSAAQGWRLAREALWAIAKEYDWPDHDYQPEMKQVAQLERDAFTPLVGRYRRASKSGADQFISITQHEGQLHLEISDYPGRIELYHSPDGKFFTVEFAMTLNFIKDANGAISEVASDHGWRAKRE